MVNETWRMAADFPNYEVSDQGAIRRVGSSRPLVGYTGPRGRHQCTLRRNGTQKSVLVYRLIAAAFIGPISPKMEVNHINGNPRDNRLCNLEIVTRAENFRHARDVLKNMGGFHPGTGSSHHQAVLMEADIPVIREMFAAGVKPALIAAQFGIQRASIYPIVRRVTWKHVK